ncbi:MAG TPA: hypothetical protein PLQ13_02060 [Candidatus Krumholzibacteria bacterium]|nr:hypothetical protein [Candidatus Krumholzibacteria bacterium]
MAPEVSIAPRPGRWRRLEGFALAAVALHSYAVGAMLLFVPAWTLRFAGWGEPGDLFFPRQSGAFHFVVATAYAWEWLRHRTVTLLLMTKAVAVVFLLVLNPWRSAWSVPFSGVFDGLMLAGMAWLDVMARREARRPVSG